MKFILNKDKLTIEEKESFNSGSLQYYEILIEKDTSWEGLSIGAIIIKEGANKGTAIAVINNRVYVDRETNGKYFVGFKGYTVEYNLTEDIAIDSNKTYYTRSGEEGAYIYTKVDTPIVGNIGTYYEETKTYQKSTNLVAVSFLKGAGEVETTNEDIPASTEWEAYVAQLQSITSEIDGLADDLADEVQEVETKLANGDFDGADGQDGITPTIGQNGNWFLGETDTGKPSRGANGINGTNGTDGYSPTATVTSTASGATITITDKNGTTTANITNGTNRY